MVRSLGRGLRLLFFAGGQSWRVESSPSWEEGVRYRVAGSGEDRGDEAKELISEQSETSNSMMNEYSRGQGGGELKRLCPWG